MSAQPIEIVQLASQRAVTVRRTVPQTELGAFFMEIFPKLQGAIRAQGATPAGPRFARYYNGDPTAFDTEAGIPFTGSFMLTGDEMRVSKLPAGRAAKTVHIGPYHTLSLEYRRLEKWLVEEGLRAGEGPWESYLDDETKIPEKHLRTEVYWPLVR
jgi:effector-binding domain-containing protein